MPSTTQVRELDLRGENILERAADADLADAPVKPHDEKNRGVSGRHIGVGIGAAKEGLIDLRAAFKAVQSGRQVVVLVPTTILADQHARTFSERLADFPVNVKTMSRFQTAKEQAAVLADLKREAGD